MKESTVTSPCLHYFLSQFCSPLTKPLHTYTLPFCNINSFPTSTATLALPQLWFAFECTNLLDLACSERAMVSPVFSNVSRDVWIHTVEFCTFLPVLLLDQRLVPGLEISTINCPNAWMPECETKWKQPEECVKGETWTRPRFDVSSITISSSSISFLKKRILLENKPGQKLVVFDKNYVVREWKPNQNRSFLNLVRLQSYTLQGKLNAMGHTSE